MEKKIEVLKETIKHVAKEYDDEKDPLVRILLENRLNDLTNELHKTMEQYYKEQDVVYFTLSNIQPGVDYPDEDPFLYWMGYYDETGLPTFIDNGWCASHKICVVAEIVNLAFRFCITAPKEWVEKFCPRLLNPENSNFVHDFDPDNFLKYGPENFGVTKKGEF